MKNDVCGIAGCRNRAEFTIAKELIKYAKKDLRVCKIHLLEHLRGESVKIGKAAELALDKIREEEAE